MPYQSHQDGLYLAVQPSEKNGIPISHYGVIDIGNILEHPESDGSHPIVIHQTPPSIRADWLGHTGNWDIIGKVTDTQKAIQRIKEALENPEYDLFGNNCEHFARYVTEGVKTSRQVFWAGVSVVAIGSLAVYLFKKLQTKQGSA
ncbi:lecithin retinol acyltransferase family protein [Sulfurimonas sp. HSL1-2]|uniref:lecithin retinol acyltransferase family protein n=1 Tax=Thiomicrolovo zhangzhouensis TaxID=3131933 RepID=UPI0031F889D8